MIRISNEVKVGAVTLLTVLVFIWLFNFLKGKQFFKDSVYYYAVYDRVGGLAESSPVEVNGFKVGVVQSIDFLDATSGRLLVEFSVNKDFLLPLNTVAEIVPVSLLGGMKVQFVYGNGPGFYSEGDTIPGKLATSIIDKVENELIPVKEKISNLIIVMDSVISSIDEVMNEEFRKNLGSTVANLNRTTGSMSNIVTSKESDLKETIENINSFSGMLSRNSEKISSTFGNLEAISDSLAAADIYSAIKNLKESLENASKMIENLNNGKGTAGQFITNDSVYVNLNNSLKNLNELLEDMKANPKKYVHFSVFGKKSSSSK